MADELDSKEEVKEEQESTEVDEETQDDSEDEQSSKTQEEETSDDSDEEESETTDAFEKRFTQFKGETPEEYIKNLEDGYANSTAEAIKLNKALTESRQQAEPSGDVTTPATDPALLYARQQMEAKQSQEYDAFAKEHPEIETDPEISEKMTKRLATLAKTVLAEEGRVLEMGEGLAMSYASLGLDNDQQENTRMAAKNAAATTKTASSKKNAPKAQHSSAVIEAAKKFGLSEKDLLPQTS